MFTKVRFTNGTESTAGLIVDSTKHNPNDVSAISRLFPYSESMKMKQYQRSPDFTEWLDAFAYTFE